MKKKLSEEVLDRANFYEDGSVRLTQFEARDMAAKISKLEIRAKFEETPSEEHQAFLPLFDSKNYLNQFGVQLSRGSEKALREMIEEWTKRGCTLQQIHTVISLSLHRVYP